ncbi:MAG: hypothetical protein GQ546_05770 [Gammaproteobacteria bacterium]|nr:hypothetical protein [Gammaproteobacteria bacterium]
MSKHVCDSEFSWCPSDARVDDFYKLRIEDLSPTQFAVGKAEIKVRAGHMRKKLKKDPGKLHDYLRVRPIPIVVRGDKFYLVDHHHLVRALYDVEHKSLGNNICVYVKVLANASSLEEVYFWKTMHERNMVYLFDRAGGGPQQPKMLPKHIKELAFDPYRSLAWIVREQHGYIKNNAPFSEFKWANFFRTRVLLDQDILAGKHTFDDFAFEVDEHGRLELTDDGKEVVDEVLYLASSNEARGLPGYRGNG